MSKEKIRLDITARMIDFQHACAILGRSPEWVRVRLDSWKAKGHPFPETHPVTGNYDVIEVNDWLNQTRKSQAKSQKCASLESLTERTERATYLER
jgi:uncharacterized protein YhdP